MTLEVPCVGELLSRISSPADLKQLSTDQMRTVASELRQAIIEHLSRTGGHFASNLGAVDLILAMHAVYEVPRDKIIYDVGHQCYAHKMLTGRLEQFPTLRQYGGISGFLRREESPYDLYGAGHASTSISAAYGFAVARDLAGGDWSVVAVIGDAGLTGGLALEGLNNAGHSGRRFTVVLNDNEMSISRNVGALAKYLAKVRTSPFFREVERRGRDALRRLPGGDVAARAAGGMLKHSLTHLVAPERTGLFFEEMGFEYIGPLDGHDLPLLLETFRQVREVDAPLLVHLITTKGKGYDRAEDDARKFHAVVPFEPDTGEAIRESAAPTYTSVFGDTLVELAECDPRIVAITAAMCDGTGLTRFSERFPDRYFDVGIAEEHAICFAAGLAADGLIPVAAIYSTFLQRSFDMVLHDVALQNLPVIFAIDRAGLVGEDGGTHHGAFDLSYLRIIPSMTVMAPRDSEELRAMLRFCVEHASSAEAGPIAVRYPRGAASPMECNAPPQPIALGRAETLVEGDDVAIVAIGSMVRAAFVAAQALLEEGIRAAVVNARFARPLDEDTILRVAERTRRLVLVEENAIAGGFGASVLELLSACGIHGVRTRLLGIPDHFVEHGAPHILRKVVGLTADDIVTAARDLAGRALRPPDGAEEPALRAVATGRPARRRT